jgi:hypothetical protein
MHPTKAAPLQTVSKSSQSLRLGKLVQISLHIITSDAETGCVGRLCGGGAAGTTQPRDRAAATELSPIVQGE